MAHDHDSKHDDDPEPEQEHEHARDDSHVDPPLPSAANLEAGVDGRNDWQLNHAIDCPAQEFSSPRVIPSGDVVLVVWCGDCGAMGIPTRMSYGDGVKKPGFLPRDPDSKPDGYSVE